MEVKETKSRAKRHRSDSQRPRRVRRRRAKKTRPGDVNPNDEARTEALHLWKRDELGSFCVDTLTRLQVVKTERRTKKALIRSGSSVVKNFEYRERSAIKGYPISRTELERRQTEDDLRRAAQLKQAERLLNSRRKKKRDLLEASMLDSRSCLAALIGINQCCGGISDNDTVRPRFLCADDIFVARSQILEAKSTASWIMSLCNTFGSQTFSFDSIPLCDACFCLLYDIKVTVMVLKS